MPTALKNGYSKATIADNIGILVKDRFPRAVAIVRAFNAARASYFKSHPHGALPEWLSYPKGRRLASHYHADGSPMKKEAVAVNPVRELDIPPEEMDEIRRDVQKQMTGKGAAVRKAAALYTDFTGHEDVKITKVSVAGLPKAALAIGQVDGILYSTVRDGQHEKYIHRFKSSSRPLLLSSPDGKQLYLIGGSYDFTERGIVDR